MSTTNLYQGLEPGKTLENVNYSVDLFLGVGEGTYNNHVIAKDQGVLMPGQVMGLSTADNKLYVVDDGGANGIDEPFAVLVHAVDTSAILTGNAASVDSEIQVLERTTALLNGNALTLGGTYTLASIRGLMTKAGLSFRTPGYSG